MRGIFVGDLHLDRLRKLYGAKCNKLQAEEIRKPLEYALDKGIKTVIFGGDVCEYEVMSYDAHKVLFDIIIRYGKKLRIHIILGNHDFAEDGMHSLELIEMLAYHGVLRCSVYTKAKQVLIDSVPFNFLPFPHKKALAHPSLATVNVGHFETSGSIRDNGSKSKSALKIHDKNLWLMGHLHTPHTVGDNIFYSGTLYQLNFGESLPKGWVEFKVTTTKSGALKHDVDFVRNDPAFKLFSKTIESARDLHDIEDNPLHKYSVFVKKGVVLPENVRLKYPGIATLSGYKTKKELEALQTNSILPIEQQTLKKVNVLYGLKHNLRKQGANDKQIRRAFQLLKGFRK